ncbi:MULTISPECIES: hypothetical protein [Citrobacter]|uniref:Uncharacterized protein n=1 Tax=Citrobacter werkmanii TaxID=67827 RepID=A0A9N8GT48_9ENTR|nr:MULTISPECIES: hypothetical protein [Citrobacter]MEB1122513.1 hypothetical protein [Citrobacter freundii]MDM3100003.1 hypothetical protein [Citrobacter sp. Cf140]CAB5539799.1 Uncharacterised protein [Citrobacter werkmanii]CAB5547029.1 Uncharacterised protein [Citrobacter werkmanii]CAB5549508.1 Uncharacterised protein [Citrobacter werkmanii]
MKIARNMNFVLPVETDMGQGYVHATPISKEVYRQHFYILSKTFSAIFSEGLGVVAGPRVAYLMLEKICQDQGIWDGASGVKNTLVNEIIRLSNLVYPVEGKGWDTVPLEVAIDREVIDPDEALGELVFFTCVSSINKPHQAKEVMEQVAGMWGSAISSLMLTEWIASLPTSKQPENTGETASKSSVKSSTTAPESDSPNSGLIPE